MRTSKLKTNQALADKGVWVIVYFVSGGVSWDVVDDLEKEMEDADREKCAFLRIGMKGNSRVRKYLRNLPDRVKNRYDILSEEEQKQYDLDLVANCYLFDWRWIEDDESGDIEFSVESAISVLSETPVLISVINEVSDTNLLYQAKVDDKIAKN